MRKDLAGTGIVQGGILFSGIPTEVWEDPYAEGVARDETDRDSTGVRLQWDRILGSAFEFTFSYRDVSIDTERSGEGVTSVACPVACQDLLRRDGDQFFWDLSYLFRLGEGQRHLVRPKVRYVVDDRDGAAISSDAYQLQLSYIYLGQGYSVASNLVAGSTSYDEANPIFGVKTDSDRFAVDTTLFYRLPTASGRWQAMGYLLWGEDDSDVTFHDNEVFQVGIGAMYRFGAAETCPCGSRSRHYQLRSLIERSSIGRPSPSTSCQSLVEVAASDSDTGPSGVRPPARKPRNRSADALIPSRRPLMSAAVNVSPRRSTGRRCS